MKKIVSLLLVVLLFCSAFMNSASAAIDLSVARDVEFNVDMNDSGDVVISAPWGHTKFEHKYSLSNYPSYIYSDMILMDYFSDAPTLLLRLWIDYSASSYLGLQSVSIEIGNTEYTFTGLGGTDCMKNYGTNIRETDCIIMGSCNFAFQCGIENIDNIWDDQMLEMSFPMTLHGIEDVETEIPGLAIFELYVFYLLVWNGLDTNHTVFFSNYGTSMTTKTIY